MTRINPTREKIMNEAFLLFSENGFESTSMNQIAARIGVTKPALYTYFSGKEDLVLAILGEIEANYSAYMKGVIAASKEKKTIEARLYHLFERYIEYFFENVNVSAFWIRIIFFPPPALREKLAGRMSETEAFFFKTLKSFLMEGMDRGVIRKDDVDQMALSFYALREGMLMTYGQKVAAPSVKTVWKNFWMGLKGDENEGTDHND